MSRLPLYASRLSRPPRELQRTHIYLSELQDTYILRAAGRMYTQSCRTHISSELQDAYILRAAGHIYPQSCRTRIYSELQDTYILRAAGRIYTPRAAGHICTCHIESDWGFCTSCAEYSRRHNSLCVCVTLSLSLSLALSLLLCLSLTLSTPLSLSLSLSEAIVGTAKIAAGHL